MEEIRRLPSTSRILFLECQGNTRPEWRAPTGEDRPAHARLYELQRVDRRAALAPAARGRRPEGRHLDRRRGRRRQRQRAQHPHGEGDGRRPGRLRPERRGGASGERLPAAAHRSGLDGQRQRQVAAPHQGRGPALPDANGRRGATHPHAGRQGPTAPVHHGGEVGDHLPLGRPAAAGSGVLRDQGPGVVGPRAGPPGGGLDGRWKDLAGRSASRNRSSRSRTLASGSTGDGTGARPSSSRGAPTRPAMSSRRWPSWSRSAA